MKLKKLFVAAAALAAFLLPAQLGAQTAAAPQARVIVAAPAWQHGAYWAQVDHRLLVDFANLARFRQADRQLGPPAAGQTRVVFMGDSITEGWKLKISFPEKPYINRGISGQTTPQMLLRFRQDVIALQPKVVLILGGTNDLAQNTGPMTARATENNLMSMAQLAAANRIRVVLCSVLPSVHYWWHPELPNPAARIVALNRWIQAYAARQGYVYVNYYTALADEAGGLPKKFSRDGVHPSPAGYAVMAPLAAAGIRQALKRYAP